MADIRGHNARHPVCLLQGFHMEQSSMFSPFASPPYRRQPRHNTTSVGLTFFLDSLQQNGLVDNTTISCISSHCTSTSWATGVATHLLAISHSLWVFQNCVVHDWAMDGIARTAELQVVEDLHTQFALDSRTSHEVNATTLKDTLWIPSCALP